MTEQNIQTLTADLSSVQNVLPICESDVSLETLFSDQAECLCLITGVEGTSHRPLGAGMAVDRTGRWFGNLSSGCIDEDVARHAVEAMASGQPKRLRYGRGSPFMDLKLPCGGGLDVTIIPRPAQGVLTTLEACLRARQEMTVSIGPGGNLFAGATKEALLNLTIKPRLRTLVFGNGQEPRHFAELAKAVELSVTCYLSDAEGAEARQLLGTAWPEDETVDRRTAVVVFFHDHDRETEILSHACLTSAPLGQIWGFEHRRISGSSYRLGDRDDEEA